jgi:hypothetical protein
MRQNRTMHIPINHHLRPLYRVLTGLAGLYVLVFGIVGASRSAGLPLFADPRHETLPWVLGLRTNPAFSYLSIGAGIALLAGAVIGRNVDHYINLIAGGVFLLSGMAMMLLLQTDANFLGFSMSNCVVSFILGLVTLAAGLYGRTGSAEQAEVEYAYQHR